jgi:hypothetical protein
MDNSLLVVFASVIVYVPVLMKRLEPEAPPPAPTSFPASVFYSIFGSPPPPPPPPPPIYADSSVQLALLTVLLIVAARFLAVAPVKFMLRFVIMFVAVHIALSLCDDIFDYFEIKEALAVSFLALIYVAIMEASAHKVGGRDAGKWFAQAWMGANPARERACKEAFNLIDKNNDGLLSRIEVIQASRRNAKVRALFGLPASIRQEDGTRDRFEEVFQKIDTNDDKQIDLEEFTIFFMVHAKELDSWVPVPPAASG